MGDFERVECEVTQPAEAMCKAYYDPECEWLAQRLLAEKPEHTEADVLELAGAIQNAIEQWWDARHFVTDWQDETLPAPSNPLKED